MSADRRLERQLVDWLREQPTRAPDAVLESVVADVERTAQRHRWRRVMRRLPMMPAGFVRLAAAAAIVLAVLAGTAYVVRESTVVPGASPAAPTPSSTASPTPTPAPDGRFVLAPGLAFTYRTPPGLQLQVDARPRVVGLAHGGAGLGYGRDADVLGDARGIVVADVTGVGFHSGAEVEDAETPADFLANLRRAGVFARDRQPAALAGHPAVSADTGAGPNMLCPCLELSDHAVDFRGASRAIVAEINDRLILVQIWAGARDGQTEDLEEWLPIAMQLVDSMELEEQDK